MTRQTYDHQRFLVDNAQEAAQLFHDLFGWDIRWEGIVLGQSYVIHMDASRGGRSERYITLSDRGPMIAEGRRPDLTVGENQTSKNRIEVCVEDLDKAARRARALSIEFAECGCAETSGRLCLENASGLSIRMQQC